MRSGFSTINWLILLISLPAIAATTTVIPATLPAGIMAVAPPRLAPPLQLSDDNGKRYDLNTSRGKWVFVHFWASWCGPCKREMPAIQALQETLTDPQWQIVLINTAETDDTIFSFLGSTAPALRTLLDVDGQVTEAWAPRGLPATFLVDPAGKIRYMALGGRGWNTPEYRDFLHSLSTSDKSD